MSRRHPLYDVPFPDGWELTTVDDLKAREPHSCVAGPFGSNISSKYFVPEGVPVIRGSNLRDDLTPFVPKGFVFVSEEQAKKYKAQHVTAGDLVFTCWGTVGQVGLIPEDGPFQEYIISNKQLKLRPDVKRAVPRFLFYYFAGPEMVKHILNRAIGAAVPGINLGILKSLEVALPPLPVQRRIASILGGYDDLIENNLRRIKILEEMAQSVYREWFVNFRFPGHEKHGPRPASNDACKPARPNTPGWHPSPLGPVPTRWETVPVVEAVELNPSTRVPREGLKPFVPMSGLSTDSMLIGEIEHREGNSGAKFRNGDTLFARITPCLENGKTGYVQFLPAPTDVAFGSTEYIVLRSRTLTPEWVYLMARSDEFRDHAIKSMSGATGRQRVQEACFKEYLIAQPPREVLNQFQGLVKPMFEMIHALAQKNTNLRQTRDFLLPKLISGEVAVTDADSIEEEHGATRHEMPVAKAAEASAAYISAPDKERQRQ